MTCLGKRARRAAIFQDELCHAILVGLHRQLVKDGRMRIHEVGITTVYDAIEEADDYMRKQALLEQKT